MDVQQTASKNIFLRPVITVSICEHGLPMATTKGLIIHQLLLVVPQYLLLGATAVPLAIDQITGGSNANISACPSTVSWIGTFTVG